MELINGNKECIFHQNQEPFPIFKKGQSLPRYIHACNVPIAVFGHLERSSHYTVSYPKWCVPYQGKYIKHFVNHNKNIYLAKGLSSLEAISSWYSNSLWHQIAYISKHVFPFILVSRGQMKREMGEGNRFHYVKSFQTRSFFWSVFSRILTE